MKPNKVVYHQNFHKLNFIWGEHKITNRVSNCTWTTWKWLLTGAELTTNSDLGHVHFVAETTIPNMLQHNNEHISSSSWVIVPSNEVKVYMDFLTPDDCTQRWNFFPKFYTSDITLSLCVSPLGENLCGTNNDSVCHSVRQPFTGIRCVRQLYYCPRPTGPLKCIEFWWPTTLLHSITQLIIWAPFSTIYLHRCVPQCRKVTWYHWLSWSIWFVIAYPLWMYLYLYMKQHLQKSR